MDYWIRLKQIREDKDLTQKELAAVLQITQQQYSKYEMGKDNMPIEVFMRLGAYYDLCVDYLCGASNIPKPYPKE